MNPGALSQQYCPQLNNYFMDNLTKQNEDVDPQSSTEPATMQDFDKELEDLEKDLSKSSESEMEVDTNDQQSNEQLSEAVEKLQIKEKFKSLSGAARKRFKWLIKQGLSAKEARSKAMEKVPETAIANKKRARSADSTPEEKGGKQSEQKRQKVHIASPKSTPVGLEVVPESSAATTSFANALRSIKVGVLAERYPEENLTNEQMVAIQAQILEKISEKEGGPDPQFSGIAHRPGWLSITCDDEATSQWLKSIIGEVKPWEGANLKVVEEGDLPKSKILSAYFPSSSEDTTEKILKMVKKQNSRLATSEWKILRRNNEGTAAHVIMSVDLASVELLKTLSYKISFKFGKVTLHNKSEQKSKPNVPKPAKASLSLQVLELLRLPHSLQFQNLLRLPISLQAHKLLRLTQSLRFQHLRKLTLGLQEQPRQRLLQSLPKLGRALAPKVQAFGPGERNEDATQILPSKVSDLERGRKTGSPAPALLNNGAEADHQLHTGELTTLQSGLRCSQQNFHLYQNTNCTDTRALCIRRPYKKALNKRRKNSVLQR